MSSIPSNPIQLSFVFLNFNRIQETQITCEKLKEITQNRPDIEIIAVDNQSTDGTAEYLSHQKDWLTPILLDTNDGIAGYNVGFTQSKGQYVFVLDDDSAPESIKTIDIALDLLAENKNIGIVACDILTPAGERQNLWHLPNHHQASESMAFIGCGFIIRRDLFKKIGWYPASFFLYQNEITVALETYEAGYSIYFDPRCIAIHRGNPSERAGYRRIFYGTRNTLWILREYAPFPKKIYYILSRLSIGFLMALYHRQFKAYFIASKAGLFTPLTQHKISAKTNQRFKKFWQQNSLIYHFLRLIKKK